MLGESYCRLYYAGIHKINVRLNYRVRKTLHLAAAVSQVF